MFSLKTILKKDKKKESQQVADKESSFNQPIIENRDH